ncbi:hypothetical protein L873DRAFT_1781846 [Choiromyces venosus 120613-1]|uniref:hAT-like transposase RNase-H fold domain-containing protein n=1 Tax=Choiromyces venosus 120613-1 TaxID=1336337 RepID=A0A3N4IXS2_9PEZI|nr:hypothetical protein L873DRAFT_1781846 [Choiromyces venosus 120613-1]
MPAVDELLNHLEDAKHHYSDPNTCSIHIEKSIIHAWQVLDKYYQLVDVSQVLYAAVVLDPEMHLNYFESE